MIFRVGLNSLDMVEMVVCEGGVGVETPRSGQVLGIEGLEVSVGLGKEGWWRCQEVSELEIVLSWNRDHIICLFLVCLCYKSSIASTFV